MLRILSTSLCCMVAIGLIGIVGIPAAPLRAEEVALTATGIWVEGAALIQTSGLTSDGSSGFWTVGDQNTGNKREGVAAKIDKNHKGKRLFHIKISDSEDAFTAKIEKSEFIATDEIPKKLDKSDFELVADFEGVCRHGEHLFAVIEETRDYRVANEPRTVGDKLGRVLRWKVDDDGAEKPKNAEINPEDAEINLAPWFKWNTNEDRANEKLEGIACVGKTLFLAYEKPAVILTLSLTDDDAFPEDKNPLEPKEFIDLSQASELVAKPVKNINGLEYLKLGEGNDAKEYLIAVSRDDDRLVVIELARKENEIEARRVSTLPVKFQSPLKNPMCWASAEGIAFNKDGLWLISDPADNTKNYRELLFGETRCECDKTPLDNRGKELAKQQQEFRDFVPLLFHIPKDAFDAALRAAEPAPAATPQVAAASPESPEPEAKQDSGSEQTEKEKDLRSKLTLELKNLHKALAADTTEGGVALKKEIMELLESLCRLDVDKKN